MAASQEGMTHRQGTDDDYSIKRSARWQMLFVASALAILPRFLASWTNAETHFRWFRYEAQDQQMATAPTKPRRTSAKKSVPPSVTRDRWHVRIPTSALTLAGFRDWATSDEFPEHIRVAFIGQEIFIEMSNEDLETHATVKMEVQHVLYTLVRDLKLGKFYGDGVLVSNEEASVSNNPDASFFTLESFRSGRVRLVPKPEREDRYREIEGTPDWVLEVISDSSVVKDTERLRQAYHRAGIREYWLIDARSNDIAFQILYHRKDGYEAAPQRGGWQQSRVFGHSFRLERQQDELGLWEYTLHIRKSGKKGRTS
jgi:Uma2 family endonuclease